MTLGGLLLSLFATLALLTVGRCYAEVGRLSRAATRVTDLSTQVDSHADYQWTPGVSGSAGYNLLDIVLVASVDGRLHALNRTSGEPIWSMAATSGTAPATLGPLVSTQHPDIDPDLIDDDSIHKEVYVVEPQTGDIFVMSSPDSPLQRLPFSMPQLVDMSPFSFSSDDDGRVFIGRKETSLLLIELETGRVKATLNAECPWDPFQDLAEPAEFDVDLDELDGTKPSRALSTPTEVYIGRTDYIVSIHTRPLRSSSVKPPVQKLSFSMYGPNNEDLTLQSLYCHTADDTYIQPLPSGEILWFKSATFNTPSSSAGRSPHMLWRQAFSNPIVAVFDVLRAPDRTRPFVLLQPRLQLQDFFPNVDLQVATVRNKLELAYVGLVEETGSLFAMSPESFPMVALSDAGVGRFLGSSQDDLDPQRDLPGDLDAVTRLAKERKQRKMCEEGSTDRHCLTGLRKLESSSQSRLSRLLDGAPSVPSPSQQNALTQANGTRGGVVPSSVPISSAARMPGSALKLGWDPDRDSMPVGRSDFWGLMSSTQALSAFVLCALALLAAVVRMVKRSTGKRGTSLNESGSDLRSSRLEEKDTTAAASAPVSTQLPDDPALQSSDIAGSHTPDTSRQSAFIRPSTPGTPDKKVLVLADGQQSSTSHISPVVSQEDLGDGEDSEKEGDAPVTPGKRKGLRRKRGKKKKGGVVGNGAATDAEGERDEVRVDKAEDSPRDITPRANDAENDAIHIASPSNLVVPAPSTSTSVVPSLIVSDTVLGFGSHGTVVFKGSLQGRAVAVKRLLQDFVTLASREVNVLQESDDHPNVIRYYYQESQANFLFIALELCPASLADIIERPDEFRDIVVAFDPKRALRQITSGLRHLHALKIIHRDIKPQNILISHAKKGIGETAGHRMLISDFGLCKKLDIDQTSFLPTAHGVAGTVGWRAPEILRGEVKLDDAGGDDSSRGSIGSSGAGTPTGKPTRLTKSVDIFALGCLYYYVLTNGGHPFGDRFEREVNIMKNAKSLEGLETFGEEGSEGADLINRMLSSEAYDRPDTSTCLLHPYFWDPGKRLTFLQDASDRFEIMCRDPRDPNLVLLETGAINVVGNDWHSRLDKLFIENLGKFRKYDGRSVQDLLRALRNKKHHYQDLPDNVKRLLGSMPEGFLAYFTRRFPELFLHVHSTVSASSLRNESMFRTYFELDD